MKLTLSTFDAMRIALLHANNKTIDVAQVQHLLGKASVTFGQIEYVSEVGVAAAHKLEDIKKVVVANVILTSNINAHTSVYGNMVKKTARGILGNNIAAVENFTPQANYFQHTACHSIVQHKTKLDQFYLYVIYNAAASAYLHNGKVVTPADITKYMTPSGVRNMLSVDDIVHNATHGIRHRVAVRTIGLHNIVSIKARKQFVTV